MDKTLIYWDTSNIFISAKEVAAEREGESVRTRVRVHFRNLLTVAHANRPVLRAFAVGSIPPELRAVWNRLENEGVSVQLLERGSMGGGEQGVDEALQVAMLSDALDYNGDPGIAVLLTGDGSGFAEGRGFHANLERMRRRGWRIEVLSWRHSCNRGMREWAEANGSFIALDDYYDHVTFLERPAPGEPVANERHAKPLPTGALLRA